METEDDFSESAYRNLVRKASLRFEFLREVPSVDSGGTALWRHDIDVSPSQALKLAEIESEHGVHAFYFVLLSGSFYNPFEPEVRERLKRICDLGHSVGLHFDPITRPGADTEDLEEELSRQCKALEGLLESEVETCSIHNPTVSNSEMLAMEKIGGLRNLSENSLRERYTYCSDSNGLWRFRSLWEVLDDPAVTRLYALTHPCWWSLAEGSPRKKIVHYAEERRSKTIDDYNELLDSHGRPNDRD